MNESALDPEAKLLETGYVQFLRMQPNLSVEQLRAEFRLGLRDFQDTFEVDSAELFAYYLGMVAAKNGMRIAQ